MKWLRSFHTSITLGNKPPIIPDSLRSFVPPRTIPIKSGKDQVFMAEYERTRIIPALNTYYGGNAKHDHTVAKLNELLRRHQHLPTRPITTEEMKTNDFLSFKEYRDEYIGSEKVKIGHHKELLRVLNRLKIIDSQLIPSEVITTLNEFITSSDQTTKITKKLKTTDEDGVINIKSKRKTSVANVKLVNGEGKIMVNGINYTEYFTRDQDRESITFPLLVLELIGKLNIFVNVRGGGISSKADAVKLGIVKALGAFNPIYKNRLKQAGLKSVDPRIVERKKPGKVKARKSPTWVKR
ncbi:37S ribosomal protein S9, mitochondrial [[Candida] jaroonii]|uniref:37S ribosomal protein S9, mitochondrial n=1 Tax=[Candida] jaroonii TaxID=467808 RepID=A0ACA9Y3F3_9ASCO|nr:37S ribosomal protein S9, mitochondrial [[Candida] jaroonii]